MKTSANWSDYLNPAKGFGLFPGQTELVPEQIDPAEVSGADAELPEKSRKQILKVLNTFFHAGEHPGMSCCIRYKGQLVVHRAWGYAELAHDDQPAREMTLDTPVCLFSASKAVSAMLVHKLAEDGLVDLLNPVAYYLPEFGQNGKERITIYQLLTHKAGVPNILKEGLGSDVLMDLDRVYQLICEEPSLCPEGRVTAYHAVTGGFVIAKLVEKLTGKSVSAYLDKVIRKPLKMKYFTYGLPAKEKALAAKNYETGFKNGKLISSVLDKAFGVTISEGVTMSNTDSFMDVEVPSANMFATAEETCRFFQMMLDHGEYDGKQVFQPLTIQKAVQESGKALLDRNIMLPMRYSPGFMLGGRPIGIWGKDSHHAFGHVGFSNIFCWADPSRDLSVAILNNGKPVLGKHMLALVRLMIALSAGVPSRKL